MRARHADHLVVEQRLLARAGRRQFGLLGLGLRLGHAEQGPQLRPRHEAADIPQSLPPLDAERLERARGREVLEHRARQA